MRRAGKDYEDKAMTAGRPTPSTPVPPPGGPLRAPPTPPAEEPEPTDEALEEDEEEEDEGEDADVATTPTTEEAVSGYAASWSAIREEVASTIGGWRPGALFRP